MKLLIILPLVLLAGCDVSQVDPEQLQVMADVLCD